MASNGSKVHIKHESLERGITINVFGDSAAEAMELLIDTIAHIEGNTAKDCVNAAYAQQRADRQPANAKPSAGASNTPVCADCGTDEAVELITFTDRDTGEQKRRFKCQACGKWLGKAF